MVVVTVPLDIARTLDAKKFFGRAGARALQLQVVAGKVAFYNLSDARAMFIPAGFAPYVINVGDSYAYLYNVPHLSARHLHVGNNAAFVSELGEFCELVSKNAEQSAMYDPLTRFYSTCISKAADAAA